MNRDVEVHVDLLDSRTVLAGELSYETNVGGALVSTSFRYATDWLADPGAYALCPELPLVEGRRRFTGHRLVPGAVADAGPDRWGRNLLFNAERVAARREGRPLRSLSDADFVLGVDDRTRVGNLRFSDPGSARLLAEASGDVPALVDLPRLVAAAARQQTQEPTDEDIRLLVAAGTSMGGARPKVGVRLPSGRLALAKLPERDDRWDVEAWEATALTLAGRAGLRVPSFEHHRLGPDTSLLVLERFDRRSDGPTQRRVGLISADTLLEKGPMEILSYVDLVDRLGDVSVDPVAERRELFDRVALTLLVTNVDDHLRNHALLRMRGGWELSPVFDVNPFPTALPVESTPVASHGLRTGRSVAELVEAAAAFGLARDQAMARIARVEVATRQWVEVARSFGIEDPAGSVVATAFEHENRIVARSWATATGVG